MNNNALRSSVWQEQYGRRMISYIAFGFLALVAIASITIYLRYHRDMDVVRARLTSIPTEVYTSKYGDIEYSLVGNGPVVLVSHGVTGGVDQGITITDSFVSSGEGYRFLYVSRFGYLKSSAPPNDASARLQAAAYKDLLAHLGIDQVFVFGNSAGGPSAMWFAIDFPERIKGLILLSSAAPTSGPPPAIPPRLVFENDFLYWTVVKVAPDTLLSILLPVDILSTLTTEEKASLIKNVFMSSLPVSERTEGINFDNYISTPSVTDIPFEQIKVPTLILQAVDDPREREGGSELAERIADSKLVGLTGGHFLLREEKKVQTAIAEFIAKNE